LVLALMEEDGQIIGSLDFRTELFDPPTVSRMATHYQRLLESIVADPSRRIGDLPLLTQAERHTLLVEWNHTQADYPRGRCIHDLFTEQAVRTPNAVAVVSESWQLTYQELDQRAKQLANYLRPAGIGPEARVGVCLERSPEMLVAMLAVLKAGGAYVPLDPSYPRERLALLLDDAGAALLLTQSRLRDRL